jgi:hypothetical protein
MEYKDLQKPLSISDVDFRVQSINNGGYATILAYKDARVDMNRLDEVLGAEYWQRDAKIVNRVLFVGVVIYNEKINQWIWKWDAGTKSNTEADKGQASDAFKRACFNLGIGRELYSYPIISIKLNADEITEKNGKKYASWGFKLKEWKWLSQFGDDGELSFLAAKDTNGVVRFKYGVYDKDREEEETTAGGAPEPVPVDVEPPVIVEGDDSNVEGFLKKKSTTEEASTDVKIDETPEGIAKNMVKNEEVDEKRAALLEKYKDMFGKTARSNIKTETLETKINDEAVRLVDAENAAATEPDPYAETESPAPIEEAEVVIEEAIPEVEVDLGMFGGLMSEDAKKIAAFTGDRSKFIEWAVATYKSWSGKVPAEHIAEFQKACNAHASTL